MGMRVKSRFVHGNLPLPVQACHMRILRRVQDQPLGMYPRQQLLRQFLTVVMVLFVPVFQAAPYLRRRLQPLRGEQAELLHSLGQARRGRCE